MCGCHNKVWHFNLSNSIFYAFLFRREDTSTDYFVQPSVRLIWHLAFILSINSTSDHLFFLLSFIRTTLTRILQPSRRKYLISKVRYNEKLSKKFLLRPKKKSNILAERLLIATFFPPRFRKKTILWKSLVLALCQCMYYTVYLKINNILEIPYVLKGTILR